MHRFDVKNINQRKTTRSDLIWWIYRFDVKTYQNIWVRSQNYESQSNYNELHRFDVKIKNVEITTTQNYESDQIIMHCIDLTSKRSRMLRYVAKHSKQRKSTKLIILRWICIDLTSKRSTTTQNYESDQIIMHCINLTSKRSKKLSYVPKLQKKSNYNELHGFDVKTIRNVEFRRKTFKTTQNYESHQITMNCIDLMSKTSNQRKTTKVILFRWISIDLTSKLSKHLS